MAADLPSHERVLRLTAGWRVALSPPDACTGPPQTSDLDWTEAGAWGPAAQMLAAAGRWSREAPVPLHDQDVWLQAALPESGRRTLRFEGLATFAEVWLDETLILTSASMFEAHDVEADIAPGATLRICCRALTPRLAAKPAIRARWRPRMIEGQGLRAVRTTLLGHMPGWCPPIDIVGAWRPVSLVERGPVRISGAVVRPDWRDGLARLSVEVRIEGADKAVATCAGAEAALAPLGNGRFAATFEVPGAEPWWPHTHGDQPLYPVRVSAGAVEAELGRTGFRKLEIDTGADGRGFGVRVNGEPVFCRGACWITPDLVALGGERADYEARLRLAAEAGMNMIRVSGVGLYETQAFFELCDELGLMVWQDMMLANFDYPAADPAFAQAITREVEALAAIAGGSPSLSVICGGSEVMQQAAMLGLAVGELDWPLFDGIIPQAVARTRGDAIHVRNSPSGGALPFVVDEGVGHYFGAGAYMRPLEDVRRAGVRFASECLAFANLPDGPLADDKLGVPRDRGADWDFEDVRDHYLQRLHGRDPAALRRDDPAAYLALSQAVPGEVMAAVYSEWRRPGSLCAGGLVWTLGDLAPGAGWGVLDADGRPKAAWRALKAVLQPVQVLITDEGVNGLDIHLINERAQPLAAELVLEPLDAAGAAVLEVRHAVSLAPREARTLSAFALLGRFFDFSYAYRFGPAEHVAVRARLAAPDGAVLSEALWTLRS